MSSQQSTALLLHGSLYRYKNTYSKAALIFFLNIWSHFGQIPFSEWVENVSPVTHMSTWKNFITMFYAFKAYVSKRVLNAPFLQLFPSLCTWPIWCQNKPENQILQALCEVGETVTVSVCEGTEKWSISMNGGDWLTPSTDQLMKCTPGILVLKEIGSGFYTWGKQRKTERGGWKRELNRDVLTPGAAKMSQLQTGREMRESAWR